MSELQGCKLELTLWPPPLDIQEVWETEELEPPPDWEELITKWEEPSLIGRDEPDPEWELLPDWEELDAPGRPEPDPEE